MGNYEFEDKIPLSQVQSVILSLYKLKFVYISRDNAFEDKIIQFGDSLSRLQTGKVTFFYSNNSG
jgi:hypothetical protein